MSRMSQGNAQAFALTDGIIRESLVLADFHPFAIHEITGAYLCVDVRNLLAEEITIITFDETNLHAFASFRLRFETFFLQVFAYFLFGVVAQWEKETPEHFLWQSPKEIGLVFGDVVASHDV